MGAQLVDLSHHNAEPNWAALGPGGTTGVILKASEGDSFVDPVFAPWRAAAHAAQLAVGAYHFTRLLNAKTEAAWFARCLGGRLLPGEFVALDLEVAATGVDPVAWVGQWIDALAALGIGVRVLYLNQSELAGHNWAPIVARGIGLWLADYDHNPATPGPHGAWPAVTLKQYTDAGSVPGETGAVDINALFGALTDLTGGIMATLGADDLRAIYETVWFGTAGADLVSNFRLGHGEWPNTILGALEGRVQNEILPPLLAPITAKLDALTEAVAQLAHALAALPAAQANMVCQGNPKAVLAVIGSAATAAAAAT